MVINNHTKDAGIIINRRGDRGTHCYGTQPSYGESMASIVKFREDLIGFLQQDGYEVVQNPYYSGKDILEIKKDKKCSYVSLRGNNNLLSIITLEELPLNSGEPRVGTVDTFIKYQNQAGIICDFLKIKLM